MDISLAQGRAFSLEAFVLFDFDDCVVKFGVTQAETIFDEHF